MQSGPGSMITLDTEPTGPLSSHSYGHNANIFSQSGIQFPLTSHTEEELSRPPAPTPQQVGHRQTGSGWLELAGWMLAVWVSPAAWTSERRKTFTKWRRALCSFQRQIVFCEMLLCFALRVNWRRNSSLYWYRARVISKRLRNDWGTNEGFSSYVPLVNWWRHANVTWC